MTEHKRCPFCGGEPEFIATNNSRFVRAWVKCRICNSKTYAYLLRDTETGVEFLPEEKVWEYWDRRCDRE